MTYEKAVGQRLILAETLESYAALLRKMDRATEADRLYERAKTILRSTTSWESLNYPRCGKTTFCWFSTEPRLTHIATMPQSQRE